MASDDYGFPVRLSDDVTRHPDFGLWRVAVAEPASMVAAWITHECLCGLLGADPIDPVAAGALVARNREAIEEAIGIAAMEHWPDELGIRPEGNGV